MTSKQLANEICKALSDKKAFDIVTVNISEGSLADFFVVASGRSTTQVKALAEHVEETLEKQGIFAKQKEGLTEGRWTALDYSDVIVHIFVDEARRLYQLDKLWNNGLNVVEYND